MRVLMGVVGSVVLLAVAQPALAQMPLNIAVGPTFTNVVGDDSDDDSTTGFFVAVGTSFALNETFSIEPHAVYVQKGSDQGAGDDFSVDYIEIPVFLNANFPVGESSVFSIGAGPQVSFNINCDDSGFDCSDEDDFNSTDYGIVTGATFAFPISDSVGLSVGGGADFSFGEIRDGYDAKNRAYYLLVGLGFAVGG